jgi:hypothetical protein
MGFQDLFLKPRVFNLVNVLQQIILIPSSFSSKDDILSDSKIPSILFWSGEYLDLSGMKYNRRLEKIVL